MICYLFPEPSYLIFSNDVPSLLYYSHIPIALLAIFTGFFVFINNWRDIKNRLLLFISLSFACWTAANLVLWTAIDASVLLFTWPLVGIFGGFISIFSIYFTYTVINEGKDVSALIKIIFLSLLAPLLFFAHTDLDISGFNITDCDAFIYEGTAYLAYQIFLSTAAIAWIFFLLWSGYRKSKDIMKQQILLLGFGLESFLLIFFSLVYLTSHLTSIGFLQDSRFEFIALFGMAIFLIAISVMVVRFRAFNTKLITAQVLTATLFALVFSLLFVDDRATARNVIFATLLFLGAVGFSLVQNVRREVAARERNELLAKDLARVNIRLRELDRQKSEFVSIASHQLRSPLTAIRGYASMLVEGSYGKVPQKAVDILERIQESSTFMAMSIEDFLNVSRIEQGKMKYELADTNIKDMAEKVADELRPTALKRGLVLMFRTSVDGKGIAHVDPGKMRQVIYNLVDNSLKYTPKGTIHVVVTDQVKTGTISITIKDTGIGMSEETKRNIFDKFVRAKNANSVNVSGTGLGLYVAKQMIEAMNGRILADSEGENKGSSFTIIVPMVA